MSPSLPLISVLIPTYGHADFVLATLDSVFAQTYPHYEIIVVNDGSPDDTAQRLAPLAHSGRIRYLEQANQGQASARNRALAEAKGEFVAYLDDDDLWPPDKLEWQINWLDEQQADVVTGGVTCIGGRSFMPTRSGAGEILDFYSFFTTNPIFSPGQTLIRRAALHQVGGWNVGFRGSDDLDLWFRLAKATPFWAVAREALYYRLHASNASNNTVMMAKNVWAVLEWHLAEVEPAVRRRYRGKAAAYLQIYLGSRLFHLLGSTLRQRKAAPILRHLSCHPIALLRVLQHYASCLASR